MAETDPAGQENAPHQFVFGELSERVGRIEKAWDTAALNGRKIRRKTCYTDTSTRTRP